MMKKIKISKNMKTKAEKILVIGSQGSGIESRLLNHNLKQVDRFVIYQSIGEMRRAEDDFYNYNCIIIFSALSLSAKDMDYYKNFLLWRVVWKDKQFCPLSAYIPLALGLNEVIVFEKGYGGYSVYESEKLKSKFLNQSDESIYIKAKESSTGKVVDLNPNINDTYFDTLICNKFKIGELILISGKLPDKWKCTDI